MSAVVALNKDVSLSLESGRRRDVVSKMIGAKSCGCIHWCILLLCDVNFQRGDIQIDDMDLFGNVYRNDANWCLN